MDPFVADSYHADALDAACHAVDQRVAVVEVLDGDDIAAGPDALAYGGLACAVAGDHACQDDRAYLDGHTSMDVAADDGGAMTCPARTAAFRLDDVAAVACVDADRAAVTSAGDRDLDRDSRPAFASAFHLAVQCQHYCHCLVDSSCSSVDRWAAFVRRSGALESSLAVGTRSLLDSDWFHFACGLAVLMMAAEVVMPLCFHCAALLATNSAIFSALSFVTNKNP